MYHIAIDWGSSCLRSYLLDQQGQLIASRQSADGILMLQHADFASVLQQQCKDWLEQCELIMMAGMITSRHGWYEVPYLPCPVTVQLLTSATVELPEQLSTTQLPPIRLVPGLRYTSPAGVSDVMRGEETQIFGALSISDLQHAWLCLPGTHSKWALVQHGQLTEFHSFISGELFALLRQHSSLASFCQHNAIDKTAFMQGVQLAATQNSQLLHQLFSVRAQVLTGQLPQQSASSFLSGLIIGHELSTASRWLTEPEPLLLVGNSELVRYYQLAAGFFGIPCQFITAEAASVAGFAAICKQSC